MHYVYFAIFHPWEDFGVKIGFTRNIKRRMRLLFNQFLYDIAAQIEDGIDWEEIRSSDDCLKLLEIRECDCLIDDESIPLKGGRRFAACRTERFIQNRLERFRIGGEYFRLPVGIWMKSKPLLKIEHTLRNLESDSFPFPHGTEDYV